jgi:hypothetical protein
VAQVPQKFGTPALQAQASIKKSTFFGKTHRTTLKPITKVSLWQHTLRLGEAIWKKKKDTKGTKRTKKHKNKKTQEQKKCQRQ